MSTRQPRRTDNEDEHAYSDVRHERPLTANMSETATARKFSVEYTRKIVREADACKTPGAVGALLRREELYSSHLTTWRAARERGDLAGAAKKRGPARRVADPRDKRITELERENT